MNSERIETKQATTYPRGFAQRTDWKWPLVPARQLVALNYGRALKADIRQPGNIPVYGTNGQCGWHNTPLAKGPGLILGRKGQGPLGVEWCAKDFWVIDTAYYASTLTPDVDLKYLYHLIKYVGLNHLKDGTSNPTLSRNVFGAQLFPLPSLAEQKAITETLAALDDRIVILRETNTTLEAIAQALFKSWFVDFNPVRARQEGRAPEGMDTATAALFPDSFDESELGLVPIGWNVGILGDILCLRNERIKPSEKTAALPYVPIECISSKVPFLEGSKPGEEANSSLILFKNGDILFGAMRPYFHKVCIAPYDGVTRTTAFTLKPINERCSAYALFLVYQDTTIEFATKHSEGSTIPYSKWTGSLEKMPIVVPNVAVQEAFGEVVSSIILKANEGIRQAHTLTTLRDTLLPRLISGQLRLPEAVEMIDELRTGT